MIPLDFFFYFFYFFYCVETHYILLLNAEQHESHAGLGTPKEMRDFFFLTLFPLKGNSPRILEPSTHGAL